MEYPFTQEDFFDDEQTFTEFLEKDQLNPDLKNDEVATINEIVSLINTFLLTTDLSMFRVSYDAQQEVVSESIQNLLDVLPNSAILKVLYDKRYDSRISVTSYACIHGQRKVIEKIFGGNGQKVESMDLVYAADNRYGHIVTFLWKKVSEKLSSEELGKFSDETLDLFIKESIVSPCEGFKMLERIFHNIPGYTLNYETLGKSLLSRIEKIFIDDSKILEIDKYTLLYDLMALTEDPMFQAFKDNPHFLVRLHKKRFALKQYELADGNEFYQKRLEIEEEGDLDDGDLEGGVVEVFTINNAESSRQKKDLNRLIERSHKPLIEVTEEKLNKVYQLKNDFPNFGEIIDYIADNLTLKLHSSQNVYFEPLLLVGKPGIGKTEFISELHTILDVGFYQVNGGSIQANFTLSGADATWSGAKHGAIANRLIYDSSPNFIFYLDEIDKTISTNGNGGDPLTALYDLLENRTAKRFVDSYYGESVTFNASYINFIASANTLDSIAEPILSRFNVFEVDFPTDEHLRLISQRIHEGLLNQESLTGKIDSNLDNGVLNLLSTCSPREVKKLLKRAYASVLRHKRNSIGLVDLEHLVNKAKTESNGIGFMATIQ